ncbi:MAG: hypothetical protein PUA64_00755 [Treponema sp.]|nr:hypothetical protein [Treponema sp.]
MNKSIQAFSKVPASSKKKHKKLRLSRHFFVRKVIMLQGNLFVKFCQLKSKFNLKFIFLFLGGFCLVHQAHQAKPGFSGFRRQSASIPARLEASLQSSSERASPPYNPCRRQKHHSIQANPL